MSLLTTGEVAKAAQVSIRTVQYYDQCGLLHPSRLTEGGRRLYTQADLEQLLVICYLRSLDFSISQIKTLLNEKQIGPTILQLLELHIADLKREIDEKVDKLDKLVKLKKQLHPDQTFSIHQLKDISLIMKNRRQWYQLQARYLLGLTLIIVLYVFVAYLAEAYQLSWLPWVSSAILIVIVFQITRSYKRQIIYLCPICHQLFQPTLKAFMFAPHTPKTRKLTCSHCHEKHWCIELVREKET